MTEDRTATEIREKLVQDEQQIIQRELERVQRILWLDNDGNSYPVKDLDEFSQHEQILLHLTGRLYASHGGLVEDDTLSTSELADLLDKDNNAISARASELDQFVESPSRGEYRIKEQYISKILDKLEGNKE